MSQQSERMAAIGKMIATVRQNRNLTQQELADKIGLTRDRVSDIEQGKVNMTFNTFFRLCDALKCIGDITMTPLQS